MCRECERVRESERRDLNSDHRVQCERCIASASELENAKRLGREIEHATKKSE